MAGSRAIANILAKLGQRLSQKKEIWRGLSHLIE
jgi:hypothetical protein